MENEDRFNPANPEEARASKRIAKLLENALKNLKPKDKAVNIGTIKG